MAGLSAETPREPRIEGRAGRTRTSLGLRAGLAAVLAVGAAVLAVDLSDWRYVRLDLSSARRNTLDPAVLDVVDKLPEPVVIDTFFRPLAPPFLGVSYEAQLRVAELLHVLANARRDKVDVRQHDPRDFEATQERQRELGVEGANFVVLSCGARKAELQLFGELCTVDWGNPGEEGARYLLSQGIAGVVNPRTLYDDPRAYRAAQFQEFHGEELVTQALLKVSSGEAPRVYFAKGHGEPALDGTLPADLARLRSALEHDGFQVAEWDAEKTPSVPADCAVLTLIGASQPYQASMREAVKSWTEAGGRLIAAPDLREFEPDFDGGAGGGIVAVLRDFGLVLRPGIVCQPLVSNDGEKVEGAERCAWLLIDEHGLQPGLPLTDPLRLRGRRVQFQLSPSFEGSGIQSGSNLIMPVVTTPQDTWRDLAPYDYRCNPAKGEGRERQLLVATAQLRSSKAADGSVKQGRVLGFGSAYFFANANFDVNRDFALNAFNWLAAREYRLSVSPLNRSQSFLDFERGDAKPILSYGLWLGLPGLCLAIGLSVFLRRRS